MDGLNSIIGHWLINFYTLLFWGADGDKVAWEMFNKMAEDGLPMNEQNLHAANSRANYKWVSRL